MDLFAPLDLYCERTDAQFLSEPLNLISNLAFILAGALLLKQLKTAGPSPIATSARILSWQVIVVGIGSALFHSFANGWSKICDVIPIGLFILSYLWLFCRKIAVIGRIYSAFALTAFAVLSLTIASLADQARSNGGQFYFGTWMTLVCLAFYFAGRGDPSTWKKMLAASILFSLSITMRTIDLTICDTWPYGTHEFWHLFNAAVLYLVVKSFIEAPQITINARTRKG